VSAEFDYSNMSPENIREAANTAAEAIRYMIHATLGDPHTVAFQDPGDVDVVLAELEILAQRLPQLFGQAGAWLAAECRAGRLRVVVSGTQGHSPSTEAIAVSAVRQYLTEAGDRAGQLREVLHDARQVTSTLASSSGEGEQPDG
jgi:hypothetical protein